MRCEGVFEKGFLTGKGKLNTPDGRTYEGEVRRSASCLTGSGFLPR